MDSIIIKGRRCPFCKSILMYTDIRCPDNKAIRCSVCHHCDSYFLTRFEYNKLQSFLKNTGKRLKSNIYISTTSAGKPSKTKTYSYRTKNNTTKVKPSKSKLKKSITYDLENCIIKRKSCEFYENDFCSVLEEECNLNSPKCPQNISIMDNTIKKESKSSSGKNNEQKVGITAIVLSDNRKCLNNNHIIKDMKATIRIVNSNGQIVNYSIPCAYCSICDLYFVFKIDYNKAKAQGVILCPVIDRTQKYLQKQAKKSNQFKESRIHQLGYNVKKGSNYTLEQRQIILANIIENTDISKHEIISCISRPMKQHQNQIAYAEAVACWEKDLEFVNQYKKGNLPEVIINRVIIGGRR